MKLPLTLWMRFSEKETWHIALETPLAMKEEISKLFVTDQEQLWVLTTWKVVGFY